MLTNIGKRTLSFVMALVMLFSMVPVQAFATEEDGHDHVHEEEIVISGDAALTAAVSCAFAWMLMASSWAAVGVPRLSASVAFLTSISCPP